MRLFTLFLLTAGLSACGTTPTSIVQQPTTVRPTAVARPVPVNAGSIYQPGGGKLLFEDRLASRVGDTLTIDIAEQLSATSKAGNKAERTTSAKAGVTSLQAPYLPGVIERMAGINLDVSGSNKLDGKGETSASNSFNATLTASVVEVLGNGHLLVAGEKQININGEVSFLRLSGVVNPADIKAGNSVASTKLAEARIEQMASGAGADATSMPWLQRLFLKVSPF